MQSKRPLVPSFINRLDRYLLLHQPVIWTTRTHLVKWYAILFSALLTLLCFLVPDNPLADSNSFVWTTLTGVLSFLGIILWIIYLLRFNVFKRFGNSGKLDAVKNFVLFFVAIGFMIAPVYIPSAVESARANAAFENEEVVNDINAINTKINQLEYDSLNHNWSKQTFIVLDSVPQHLRYKQEIEDGIVQTRYIDTAELRIKLAEADSTVRTGDSMYSFYSCPRYTFIDEFSADEYTKTKIKSSVQLYYELIKDFKPVNKQATIKELGPLLKKYRYNSYSYYYPSDDVVISTIDGQPSPNYYAAIEKKYNLYDTENGLRNLVAKKYRWYSENDSRFRIWFYISFVITLLVFIFRHSTVKAFFLSILTCIVLLVITALMLAFSHTSGQKTMLVLCIAYYVLFLIATLFATKINTRSTWAGIVLNITTFFTFLVPLFLALVYYEAQDELYRYPNEYPPGYFETKETVLLCTEVGGIILFLVLLQPFFKRLYRSWFAKPEE